MKEIQKPNMNDVTVVGTITVDRLHFRDHTREAFGGAPWFATEISDTNDLKVGIVTNVGRDFLLERIPQPILEASKINSSHRNMTTLDIFPEEEGIPAIVKNFTGEIRNIGSLRGRVVIITPLFQEVSIELIKKLRKRFTIIIADIQGFTRPLFEPNIRLSDEIKTEPKGLRQLCEIVDVLKFSENEFDIVLPGLPLEDKLTRLHSWGIKNIVITRADKGCLVSRSGSQLKAIATKPIETSDTVGAGDRFLILLGAFLARNNSLEDSVMQAQQRLQNIMGAHI